MNLQDLLQKLEIADAQAAIEPHWDEDRPALPDEEVPFLNPRNIEAWARYCGIDEAGRNHLIEVARRIDADEGLRVLARHYERLLYDHPDCPDVQIRAWPRLEHLLGDDAPLFYMLPTLTAVPRARAKHQALGVPDAVTRETLGDLAIQFVRTQPADPDMRGLLYQARYWIRHHAAGRLFRMGRFQYMVRSFPGTVRVYRHHGDGRIVAIMEAGAELTDEGLFAREIDPPEAGRWTTELRETADSVTGYPVDPEGRVLRESVDLDLNEWRPTLRGGDPVLDIHIPAGGGMTPDACRESMQRALEFFPRYLPDRAFRAFACQSWIFNPDLPEMLGEGSNLVRFMRNLYLYPRPSKGRDGMMFIFGREEVDPAEATPRSSLERAMLDRVASGRGLFTGGMFLLVEHLSRYGSPIYSTTQDPAQGA